MILVERATVDDDGPGARDEPDARDGFLAAAGGDLLRRGHLSRFL
jgi:hypothetical protein